MIDIFFFENKRKSIIDLKIIYLQVFVMWKIFQKTWVLNLNNQK